MLQEQKKFDFAFIDGWHTFDHALIDFFYVSRLLEVGGVVVFHDVDMPSINRLLRYIRNYPSYEFAGSKEGISYPISLRRRVYENAGLATINVISHLIPNRYVYDIFSPSVVKRDKAIGLKATIAAFRKVAEDKRDWRWYEPF